MPIIEVKLYEQRVNPDSSEQLVTAMTDALASVFDDSIRQHTTVVVTPVASSNWGVAGESQRERPAAATT